MVSMPPYVVEPPDELEVSVRPAVPDLSLTTVTVQTDGNIDLGFVGDVYVAGLTLEQIEQKIAQHLTALAAGHRRATGLPGLGPAGQRQPEQVVLRARHRHDPGQVPGHRQRDRARRHPHRGPALEQPPREGLPVRPHPAGGPDQILKIDWCGIKDRGDTLTNYQTLPRRPDHRPRRQAPRPAEHAPRRRMTAELRSGTRHASTSEPFEAMGGQGFGDGQGRPGGDDRPGPRR